MMKHLYMGLFTMFFGGFFGCDNTSSLSEVPVTDPSLINVKINLNQQVALGEYSHDEIKVVLTDKKHFPINNKTIVVKVNGEEMPLHVASGNYYNKSPYYQLWSADIDYVTEATVYMFTIQLSDSTAYTLGTITTQKQVTETQFNFPDSHHKHKDLELRWQNIDEINKLMVIRATEEKDSTGIMVHMGSSTNKKDIMQKEIGPGWFGLFRKPTGKWTVPASYFKIQNGNVTDLRLYVISEKVASVEGKFLSDSYIKSTFELEKYIPVIEN